jgi:hypothetical protein
MEPRSAPDAAPPIEPTRVKAFARYFKNYMGLSSFVTAALPIPVASLGLIPTFHAQTKLLSTYASLFCFLILGFVFYTRHPLARVFFPQVKVTRPDQETKISPRVSVATMPLGLILLALMFVFFYHQTLNSSLNTLRSHGVGPTESQLLENIELSKIPGSSTLIIFYVAFFLSAELAFVLMAVKEYLQDLLGLSDVDLILGSRKEVLPPKHGMPAPPNDRDVV